MECRQALGARAPQQVQQHRLRLILPVVGGGDEVRAGALRRAAEEVVAGAAARLLHGEVPSGGEGVDLHPLGVEGDIAGIAEGADKLLVALRRGAHTVVQVRRRHAEVPLLSQTPETVQKADGVPAAGDGAEDQPAGRREHLPAGHPRRYVKHRSPPRRSGSPACRRRCIPASSEVPPCPFRRGGSSPRCTPPRCASPCRRCSSRHGRGT